jgi:hypothetical protein
MVLEKESNEKATSFSWAHCAQRRVSSDRKGMRSGQALHGTRITEDRAQLPD